MKQNKTELEKLFEEKKPDFLQSGAYLDVVARLTEENFKRLIAQLEADLTKHEGSQIETME